MTLEELQDIAIGALGAEGIPSMHRDMAGRLGVLDASRRLAEDEEPAR